MQAPPLRYGEVRAYLASVFKYDSSRNRGSISHPQLLYGSYRGMSSPALSNILNIIPVCMWYSTSLDYSYLNQPFLDPRLHASIPKCNMLQSHARIGNRNPPSRGPQQPLKSEAEEAHTLTALQHPTNIRRKGTSSSNRSYSRATAVTPASQCQPSSKVRSPYPPTHQ